MRRVLGSKIVGTLLIWGVALYAHGSTTAVTATVTDSNGQVFANGTVVAEIYAPGVPPSQLNVAGASFTQRLAASLDGSGLFNLTLTDNLTIRPAGTKWRFTICSNTSAPCFQSIQQVTGVSQNLSVAISANATVPSMPATILPRAYRDSEIQVAPGQGGLYYNVLNAVVRLWNGTVWADLGGGGGAGCVPTGPTGAVQYSDGSGDCAASTDFNWDDTSKILQLGDASTIFVGTGDSPSGAQTSIQEDNIYVYSGNNQSTSWTTATFQVFNDNDGSVGSPQIRGGEFLAQQDAGGGSRGLDVYAIVHGTPGAFSSNRVTGMYLYSELNSRGDDGGIVGLQVDSASSARDKINATYTGVLVDPPGNGFGSWGQVAGVLVEKLPVATNGATYLRIEDTDHFSATAFQAGVGNIRTGFAGNTDLVGKLTIGGGGTIAYNFQASPAFLSPPYCFATDTTTATAVKTATTTSTLTVTGTAGHVVNYLCVGQD